jgi:hypothetical protein
LYLLHQSKRQKNNEHDHSLQGLHLQTAVPSSHEREQTPEHITDHKKKGKKKYTEYKECNRKVAAHGQLQSTEKGCFRDRQRPDERTTRKGKEKENNRKGTTHGQLKSTEKGCFKNRQRPDERTTRKDKTKEEKKKGPGRENKSKCDRGQVTDRHLLVHKRPKPETPTRGSRNRAKNNC